MTQIIRLVDVITNTHEAEFGTCELCFSTGMVDEPVFVFETSKGQRIKLDGYDWDWGDYSEIEIDNVVNFSDWLLQREYPNDYVFDDSWFSYAVLCYNNKDLWEDENNDSKN